MNTTPEPESHSPDPSRYELRRLLLVVAAMLLAGGVCWWAYPPAIRLYRGWQMHRRLAPLQGYLERKDWPAAAKILYEARKSAPEDPAVLRGSLDFLTRRGGGDPRDTLLLVQKLQRTGHATAEDLAQLGKAHVQLGTPTQGQQIYDALTPEARQTRHGLELRAALLEARGESKLAAEAQREALLTHLDDPDTLRQLGLQDLRDPSAERAAAMRERLWKLARAEGSNRLVAVKLLTQDKMLIAPQAEELRRIVVQADGADAARLQVISARIRISPQLRDSLIDEEITTWKGRPPAQARPLLTWLATENEHARILRLVSPPVAAKFTDLLPPYTEALRSTGRWQELETLLTSGGIDPAFSKARKLLWQAEARAHLDPDPAPSRQMLLRLIEEGGRGENAPLTLQTADLAERLRHWDLAQRCFTAAGDKHPRIRPAMLAKVYEMADHQHDGSAMLQACASLATLKPDNVGLRLQKIYLQLLLGVDLETAELQLQGLTPPGPGLASPALADKRHLLMALLAYRQGRTEGVRAALPRVTSPTTLKAGERAVYAGLLHASGADPATIFRLLEKIAPALLLPEEKKFVDRSMP